MSDRSDAENWIALVIAKAPELRAAGVTMISYGAGSVQLSAPAAPYPPARPTAKKDPEPNYDMDPLGDPALGVADKGYDLSDVPALIREISAE